MALRRRVFGDNGRGTLEFTSGTNLYSFSESNEVSAAFGGALMGSLGFRMGIASWFTIKGGFFLTSEKLINRVNLGVGLDFVGNE